MAYKKKSLYNSPKACANAPGLNANSRMKELCPYCGKRPNIRKTCGHPECQYKNKIKTGRRYFDTYLRKTNRHYRLP